MDSWSNSRVVSGSQIFRFRIRPSAILQSDLKAILRNLYSLKRTIFFWELSSEAVVLSRVGPFWMNEINWKLYFYIPLYFPLIFDYVLFSHFYRIKISNIKNKVNSPSFDLLGLGCICCWSHRDVCSHQLLITQRCFFTSAVDFTATSSYLAGSTVDHYFIFLSCIYLFIYRLFASNKILI